MTKNIKVVDTQPRNSDVVDTQPRNQNISFDFGTEQLFTVILGAGQSMGLLLSLTYATAGTVQSPITS